jgi:Spx/MgsR family transcriptional regulator
MSTILYGIPNCDTVKKARAWLADAGIDYEFHDYKKQGVPSKHLDRWLKQLGHDKVINRKGNVWRQLDAAAQASAADAAGARALALAQPSVIKRPIVEWDDGTLTVGFDSAAWALQAGR